MVTRIARRVRSLSHRTLRRIVASPMRMVDRRTRAEALEILTNGMITETAVPGGSLKFFAPTPLLQNRAESLLTKERDMIAWLDGMDASAVLWDIGSNVGVYSLYAAAKAHCTVLAFEPSAANYFVLTRNIQINALDRYITPFCVAFADTTGLGVLNLASTEMGAALTHFGRAGDTSRYWTDDVRSSVHGMVGFTVDDFVARFAPPFPTHLKMDVDGLESAILRGATKTLDDARLRSAMIELSLTHQTERSEAIALIERAGLRLVSQGESQGLAGEHAANHLFVRT